MVAGCWPGLSRSTRPYPSTDSREGGLAHESGYCGGECVEIGQSGGECVVHASVVDVVVDMHQTVSQPGEATQPAGQYAVDDAMLV